MRRVAVIAVLMVVCAGCASASFNKCYRDCNEDCVAANGEKTWCATKCLFKCIGKDTAIATNSCNFDCAAHHCPQFGNDVDKVEDCVTKCGNNKCTAY